MAESLTFRPSFWRLPLHCAVLLALQCLHAVVALCDHLIHRPWASYDPRTRLGALRALHAASRRWTKRPTHIALVYTPPLDLAPLRPLRRRRRARDERTHVRRTAVEAARLCEWCLELGVERVSIYDRQGAFGGPSVSCPDRSGVLQTDAARFAIDFERALKATCVSIGAVAGAPIPLFTLTSTARPEREVRLAILGPTDGKPHLARVANSLGDAVAGGHISLDEITPGMMQAKLYGASLTLAIALMRCSVVRARGRPPDRPRRRSTAAAGLPALASPASRDLVRRHLPASLADLPATKPRWACLAPPVSPSEHWSAP